jgi:hypothetical protein
VNHRSLRDSERSNDIDLSYVNWGSFDLVVIDEVAQLPQTSPRTAGHVKLATTG